MQDEDQWLRLAEVARRIGQSRESARKLVISGEVKGKRHGARGMWQVRESECVRYLASVEAAPGATEASAA